MCRPQLIDGLPVDEFIARNADPLWLHQHGMWELLTDDDAGWNCGECRNLRQ